MKNPGTYLASILFLIHGITLCQGCDSSLGVESWFPEKEPPRAVGTSSSQAPGFNERYMSQDFAGFQAPRRIMIDNSKVVIKGARYYAQYAIESSDPAIVAVRVVQQPNTARPDSIYFDIKAPGGVTLTLRVMSGPYSGETDRAGFMIPWSIASSLPGEDLHPDTLMLETRYPNHGHLDRVVPLKILQNMLTLRVFMDVFPYTETGECWLWGSIDRDLTTIKLTQNPASSVPGTVQLRGTLHGPWDATGDILYTLEGQKYVGTFKLYKKE